MKHVFKIRYNQQAVDNTAELPDIVHLKISRKQFP